MRREDQPGFSPDKADALALTFAEPDMPAAVFIPGMQQKPNESIHEYDPMAAMD